MILCKEKEKEQLPDDVTELRQLKEAELLRIHHLERSNQEILDALEADEDSDLRQAIDDNKIAIETKQARIQEIDRWIAQIIMARSCLSREGVSAFAAAAATTDFPDGLAL
eukprot:TRINITY_DN4450_c0_g1_i2.p1 TRINITY_DN4450_c0_g1~~TRINITY_DN4450_c0_g1_i2.p1  ORF type:complete len:111 (-),score=35.22 TRINITY_DN4450_c0_g1_i2:271-603(-)